MVKGSYLLTGRKKVFGKSGLEREMERGGLSSGWSFTNMVSHHCGLLSGWSLGKVVSHLGGLTSGWSLIRVVSHQDGLTSGWYPGSLLFGWFSSGWSLT